MMLYIPGSMIKMFFSKIMKDTYLYLTVQTKTGTFCEGDTVYIASSGTSEG